MSEHSEIKSVSCLLKNDHQADTTLIVSMTLQILKQ